jgi:hypothetical protein
MQVLAPHFWPWFWVLVFGGAAVTAALCLVAGLMTAPRRHSRPATAQVHLITHRNPAATSHPAQPCDEHADRCQGSTARPPAPAATGSDVAVPHEEVI